MIRTSCITTRPEELQEGLFGGVFLFLFEILPYLHRRKIYPKWRIESALYGSVIPGVLDLSYAPPRGNATEIPLAHLRARHSRVLGSDWRCLSALWHAYFKVPARIAQRVEEIPDLHDSLGVHYRGNDKITAGWDTNAISTDDFATIVCDYLSRRQDISSVFVATDDSSFLQALRSRANVAIWSEGVGSYHKTLKPDERISEAENALRDCLALSQCKAVLCTSSALSAFAKVLNPELDIQRCAASKLFADIPYFPIAYVPVHSSTDPIVQSILERSLRGDWTSDARARRFQNRFVSAPRTPPLQRLRQDVKRALKALVS